MKSLGIEELRLNIADTINRACYAKERIILERRGKAVAVIVPLEDLKTLEELEDRLDLSEAEKRLADPGEKPIPYKKVRKELGLR